MKNYLVLFDGTWKTLCRLKQLSPIKLEIICTITPIALIQCYQDSIESLAEEDGIITIEEDEKYGTLNGFHKKYKGIL